MSLPKMHWLPKDQWEAPRAVTGVDELSGKAPLAGLFSGEALAAMIVHANLGVLFQLQSTSISSPLLAPFDSIHMSAGFWPTPCLLPDGVGPDSASLLASESARPAELEGEAELFDVAVAPGLASPASQLSDGSPKAEVPAAEQSDPSEHKRNHGRGVQARDPSPRSNTQQGATLPGSTKPKQNEEQARSEAAKRKRDGAYEGTPDKPADQRPAQHPRAESHDRWAAASHSGATSLPAASHHIRILLYAYAFWSAPLQRRCVSSIMTLCAGALAGMKEKEGRTTRRQTAASAAEAGISSLQRPERCRASTAAGTDSSLHPGPTQHVGEIRSGPSGKAESSPAGSHKFCAGPLSVPAMASQ